eukprot:SAG31_NODE_23325_length_506_cov_1.282555_1_plen_72_part_00
MRTFQLGAKGVTSLKYTALAFASHEHTALDRSAAFDEILNLVPAREVHLYLQYIYSSRYPALDAYSCTGTF